MMPDTIKQAADGLLAWLTATLLSVSVIIGIMGQAAYHARESQRDHHGPSFWRRMLWGVPSGILMGLLAEAVVAYFELPSKALAGLAGALGWLGPSGLWAIGVTVLRKRYGVTKA